MTSLDTTDLQRKKAGKLTVHEHQNKSTADFWQQFFCFLLELYFTRKREDDECEKKV
jgi:hypothetical protein